MDGSRFCFRCWDWSSNCTKLDCPWTQSTSPTRETHPKFHRDSADWLKITEEIARSK